MLLILKLIKEWSMDCLLSWRFLKTAVTQPPAGIFGYDLTSLQTSVYFCYLLNLILIHYSKLFHQEGSKIWTFITKSSSNLQSLVPEKNLNQILDFFLPSTAAVIIKSVHPRTFIYYSFFFYTSTATQCHPEEDRFSFELTVLYSWNRTDIGCVCWYCV